MKIYLVAALLISCLLSGCTNLSTPANIAQYSQEGYVFYGCCDYGYFNNDSYEMGGPKHLGCYTSDCSLSLWR